MLRTTYISGARRALQLERCLAIAQQAIYRALDIAEQGRDQSVAEDLWQIQQELRRLHEASVRDGRRLKASTLHRTYHKESPADGNPAAS